MKDFAKSIRTGNALSRGQVLYTRGNKKFVYGGEVNGTHIVYRQPDGKTFSFSSEEEVKQFIKDIPVYESAYVGNISADITTDGNTWFVTTSDGKKKEFTSEREAEEYVKKVKAGNSKVGNGSGSWRGKFYEDRNGNSASIEKRGQGYEVYWEDAKGYGKPLGTYPDEKTAREVAENAVESEMPDRIRASYKSKAINSKVWNSQKLYSDANVEIYDDGIVKLTQFPGYTQWAKDVDSIIRDEIRSLEKQISDLKNAASKVKEVGKKYGLL